MAKLKNLNWKKLADQLIMENCLTFGNHPKFTKRKVARYLLGTRSTVEIFKIYELRSLLLRVYPLIHNLFYNSRSHLHLYSKKLWNRNYAEQVKKQQKLGIRVPAYLWKPRLKIKSVFLFNRQNLSPQILFVSVTSAYQNILQSAAQMCNMPYHNTRWLNGSMTGALVFQNDETGWDYLTEATQKKTILHFTKKFGQNKGNRNKSIEKSVHYGRSRWPSLMVIPDTSNNKMVIFEAKQVGIPVIGLVNSSSGIEIDYPIFAQDQNLHAIHFFCHFLATLITKEVIYVEHKRYTVQKRHTVEQLKHKQKLSRRRKNKLSYNLLARSDKFFFFDHLKWYYRGLTREKVKKSFEQRLFLKRLDFRVFSKMWHKKLKMRQFFRHQANYINYMGLKYFVKKSSLYFKKNVWRSRVIKSRELVLKENQKKYFGFKKGHVNLFEHRKIIATYVPRYLFVRFLKRVAQHNGKYRQKQRKTSPMYFWQVLEHIFRTVILNPSDAAEKEKNERFAAKKLFPILAERLDILYNNEDFFYKEKYNIKFRPQYKQNKYRGKNHHNHQREQKKILFSNQKGQNSWENWKNKNSKRELKNSPTSQRKTF
jgi:ribosomal protein S2